MTNLAAKQKYRYGRRTGLKNAVKSQLLTSESQRLLAYSNNNTNSNICGMPHKGAENTMKRCRNMSWLMPTETTRKLDMTSAKTAYRTTLNQ